MNSTESRRWWPFDVVIPAERQSPEVRAQIWFLDEAVKCGLRAFAEGNDNYGAIAENGRECLLVWRGKHRAELIQNESGKVAQRKMFSYQQPADAFRQAAAEALKWLQSSG